MFSDDSYDCIRPSQLRYPPVQVLLPPSWAETSVLRTQPAVHTLDLLPVTGPDRPPWEDALLNLAPLDLGPSGDDAAATLHRATLPAPRSGLEDPPEVGFQDADGVPVHGRTAVHAWPTRERTAVLSTDWVHRGHEVRSRTWVVRASRATQPYGDIHFGLTEADTFLQSGRSVAFDVHGNLRVGWAPLLLDLVYTAEEAAAIMGVRVAGDVRNEPNSHVSVTADLEAQKLLILYENGATVSYPLDGWDVARLCVSFSNPTDVVELCATDTTVTTF